MGFETDRNSSVGLGEPERRVDNIIMSLDILQTILAGDVQEEQRNSVVAPIIQERRCIQHCGYLKGIKVLSLTMKIWERVFYRRGLEEEDKRRSSAVWFHYQVDSSCRICRHAVDRE